MTSSSPTAAATAPEAPATARPSAIGDPTRRAPLGDRVRALLRGPGLAAEASFVIHCLLLLGLLALVRPMFTTPIARESYESSFVAWDILQRDLGAVMRAAQRQRPEVPRLLFLAVPTILLLASRQRITWRRWSDGPALRVFIMVLLGYLCWSGATFDYNLFLNRFHGLDRLLLVGLLVLSWRTPLAVPFATAWSYAMIKEAYIPIPQDDFDFRSVTDILVVFSCFVWLSFRKSFKTKHFIWTALGAWASYYFVAGVAKLSFGPKYSWLLENHLSNLSVGGYVRGWLSFIPESTFVPFAEFVRRLDRPMAFFTIVVELGSLVMFYLHPRTGRLWLLLCATLHFGIFVLTGICFWKWMIANVAFYFFLARGGAASHREMCRHRAGLALGVVALWFSSNRAYFFPQTHVVWYDSAFVENYKIIAVGAKTGTRYIVNPSSLTPMEMQFVQGRLCYATSEQSVTGIYGVTGSYSTMKALDEATNPQVAMALLRRGGRCDDPERRATFDDFMIRYFGTMNRIGRPQHWLTWIRRPTHLWVQPRGNLYEMQEPVAQIDLERELVFHQGHALHRLETKVVHEIAIPH